MYMPDRIVEPASGILIPKIVHISVIIVDCLRNNAVIPP